jgi:PAS domain S-box-containing protein
MTVSSPLRILLLEDDSHDAELVRELLEAEGVVCTVARVQAREEFLLALENGEFDLVLADYQLPSFDGISALKLALSARPDLPFIFVSGTIGEELAIEALKIGATDYVLKTGLSRLVPSVHRALREAAERAERRKAEEALHRSQAYLRDSEQRFRDYAEIASDWFWESGPDHRFTRLSGLSEGWGFVGQYIGRKRLELAEDREEDPEKWRAYLAALDAHQPFRRFRYRTTRPDGSTIYVSASGKPVFDANGTFLGYRGVANDVSAEVRSEQAEQALRQAQAELAHVTRVTTLGELAASIAHEINQPLAAIVTDATAGLRWLDRPVPDLGEARQALEGITKAAKRAAEVIARIRDLTRKTPIQEQRLDINDVIREVAALMRAELVHNRVELRTELADDLPPVRGDRIELQQVVLNLVMNAIEAMSDADKRSLFIASTRDDTNNVRVSVCDSGRGLDPAAADRMFQAFYTTKPGGMGMGLAICRSIIERLGGRLSARANAPRGAILQFHIPIA